MESSAALFSAQGSPFAAGSPARSHYHPSPARPPAPRHQRTALSPARLLPGIPAAAPNPEEPPAPMVSSPPDLSFLQGSSCQRTALDSDTTDPFPESWPSTERSSPSTPLGASASGQPPASAQDGESVIAKYIERFRHGQPSSRSQRQAPPIPPTREFWWLEPVSPSDSSTPKGGASPGSAVLEEASPRWALASPLLCSRGGLANISSPELPDPDIHSLQERAARLLLRSESSLSSPVPVSSEGLHSTPESSTPDSDQALPGPPHLSLLEPSAEPVHRLPARIPPCTSSTSPEEDILFQWRLRRKMEQASQAVRSLPLVGWSTQLAWGPRMGNRAFTVRPGLGLVPGTATWRSGDGNAVPSPTVQPAVRSNQEWAPTPAMLHHGMGHPQEYWAGHPLEVPFQSAEPAVEQSPKGVHVLGQLTSATTHSSTPRPEGDGGGAAEMWRFPEAQWGTGPVDRPSSNGTQWGTGPADRPGSHGTQWGTGPADRPGSHGAQRGVGPADRPGSREAQRGAGPADRPGSHSAQGATGPAERPGSREAQRGAGPADRPGSREAQRGVGPADRPGSREAQRGAGPADRPGSREAQRGAGPADRPGSREAQWGVGPADRPGSREAQRGAGPADRPGSREAQQGAGPADRPGSREAQRGAGPADRPGSREAQQGAGPADRPGSREAQRGAGPADRPGSREAQQGAGPADRPGSREAQRGAGPADRPGSREAQQGAGPADRPGSREAQRGAWAVGTVQHIPKETPQPSKPQPLQGRASGGAPEPEATRSRRRRNRKGESSIHSALGQVISERLFSPPVSPLPCKEDQSGQGVDPGSPPEQDAAPELPAPSSQHPQLLQLAAQLLEEAEESDGAEFEEDPLLRVLRGQREGLRSRLRAVDVALAQLVSQGVAEPMSEPPGRPW